MLSSSATPGASSTAQAVVESDVLVGFKSRLSALREAHPQAEETLQFEQLFREAIDFFDAQVALRAQLTTPLSKQQRLVNLLGSTEFFFHASLLSFTWLSEAYTARVGGQSVNVLLKVLRCAPVSVSEIIRQATKGKDARFRIQVFDLCRTNAALASYGRLCGDVPTMNHTLDLVFHLHKLKVSLQKTNPELKLDGEEEVDAVGEWIGEFQGGSDAQKPGHSELELKFLGCTTPQAFKEATAEMVKTAQFEPDGEATLNLSLKQMFTGQQQQALQGFDSYLGVGRFGCSVYFTFPQHQFLLDVPFWDISSASVVEVGQGELEFELTAKLQNQDAWVSICKASGLEQAAGEQIQLYFRIADAETSKDQLQNTIDRRRFRFVKGGEVRLSRVSKPVMNTSASAVSKPQKVASPLIFRRREETALNKSPKPVAAVVAAPTKVERDEYPNSDITEVEDIESQGFVRMASDTATAAFVSKKRIETKSLVNPLAIDMTNMTVADLYSLTKNYHAHLLSTFFNIGGKIKSGRNKKMLIEALKEDQEGKGKPKPSAAAAAAAAPKRARKPAVVESEEEEAKPRRPKNNLMQELDAVMDAEKQAVRASARQRNNRRAKEEDDDNSFLLSQPPAEVVEMEEPSFGDEFDFLGQSSASPSAKTKAAAASPTPTNKSKKKKRLVVDEDSQPEKQAPPPARRITRSASKIPPSEEDKNMVVPPSFDSAPTSNKKQRRDAALQESSLPDPPPSSPAPVQSMELVAAAAVAAIAVTPLTGTAPTLQLGSGGGDRVSVVTPPTATQKTVVFADEERSPQHMPDDEEEKGQEDADLRPRVLNFKSATIATDRVVQASAVDTLSPPSPPAQTNSPSTPTSAIRMPPPPPNFQFNTPAHQPPVIAAASLPKPSTILLTAPTTKRAVPRLAEMTLQPHAKKLKAQAAAAAEDEAGDDVHNEAKLSSSSSSDGEQDDFETEEIQNDAVLECETAIASIRRAIQKVVSRRNRLGKKNDKQFRTTMQHGQELVHKIHGTETKFLLAVEHYETLVKQRQARIVARQQAVAQRVQHLAQLKRDAERVRRDVVRLRNELQQAVGTAAQTLTASSKKQITEIQKLLTKQKKEAKEWKPAIRNL